MHVVAPRGRCVACMVFDACCVVFAEELLDEKMKNKSMRDEMDNCFQELQGI